MKRWAIIGIILSFACAAKAQRPDCPPADAAPRVKPPDRPMIMPPMPQFPAHFDAPPPPPPKSGELKPSTAAERDWAERRVATHRASDGVNEVQDADVRGVLQTANAIRARPAMASAMAIDLSKTSLATWAFLGSVPQGIGKPTYVTRVFERADRELFQLDEFHYEVAGGAIYTLEGMANRRVGDYPATMVSLRGRSGCVESQLAWHDSHISYTLRTSGPLDLAAQRALLLEVAQAIVASRPGR